MSFAYTLLKLIWIVGKQLSNLKFCLRAVTFWINWNYSWDISIFLWKPFFNIFFAHPKCTVNFIALELHLYLLSFLIKLNFKEDNQMTTLRRIQIKGKRGNTLKSIERFEKCTFIAFVKVLNFVLFCRFLCYYLDSCFFFQLSYNSLF